MPPWETGPIKPKSSAAGRAIMKWLKENAPSFDLAETLAIKRNPDNRAPYKDAVTGSMWDRGPITPSSRVLPEGGGGIARAAGRTAPPTAAPAIKAPPRTRRDQTEAAAAGSDRDLWRSAPTFDLVRRLMNGPPSSGAEPSAAWTGDGISSGAEPSAVWAGDGISSGAEPGGVWGGDVISSGAEPNEAWSGPPVEPLPPPPVDTGGSSVPAEHQGLPTSGFMPEAWASEERGRTPAFGVDKENIGAGGTPYGVNDAFWAKKEYTPLPVGKNGTAADLGRGLGRDASEGWEKLAIAKNLRNMWKKK